jgi:hypothetical protein
LITELRRKYNSNFRQEVYDEMVSSLHNEFGFNIDFRIAETPVFIPAQFKNKLLKAGEEIIALLESDNYKNISHKAVPDKFNVPGIDKHPHMLALDFAVCRNENGDLFPQLIELQAFPSLYCYMQVLAGKYRKYFNLGNEYKNLFYSLDESSYFQKLKKIIIADEEPENVILLEIYPDQQKTRVDFSCTERELGVKAVHIERLEKVGEKLYYYNGSEKVRVKRIYNRVIFDELSRYKDLKLNFDFRDKLDVTWVPHPNWFFRISKYSLPYLRSDYVPDTVFLSDLNEIPVDIENYILKPLFSFSGSGVVYDVSHDDIKSLNDKKNYILQKKIKYEPVIETPDGLAKAEIRILYIYDNGYLPVNNLVRLSKGKMMGVDFNKEKKWVGSSIGFYLE